MASTLSRQDSWLGLLERAGNRLPHPALLFLCLAALVTVLSALLAFASWSATHPISGESIQVINLLSKEQVQIWLPEMVNRFTGFAPVGTVLVAMLGLGVAERSGLIAALLPRLLRGSSGWPLTASVAFAGVMSSIAADAGYVVLIPLAGILFQQAGRSPLVGMATAFAGVSGGYSANLLIGPLDAVLAGLTEAAAQLVEPERSVSVLANYWFMLASVPLLVVMISWSSHRYTERAIARLQTSVEQADSGIRSPANERAECKGLRAAGAGFAAVLALTLMATLPHNGWLRDDTASLQPFVTSIVAILAITAALCGFLYGRASGHYRSAGDLFRDMELALAGMGAYLVLMFFAAQFIGLFNQSNMGLITAIHGAAWLQQTNLPTTGLLLGLILLVTAINLLIGSASAKWALLAPVFVPMLMLSGLSPEQVQVAYRIGDSSTNIITPMMPYFGVVLAFMQRYRPDLGVGSLVALMVPYALTLLLGWSVLLGAWIALGWPLGPGS